MDYDKIYRAFIADRKRISHARGAYTERHHIIPRSLGGGDEAENLVSLTPEDHYFAHCLLAKMHGRGMWLALAMMTCRRNAAAVEWAKPRAMYGVARRQVAKQNSERFKGQEGMKGPNNGRYNETAHKWTNVDTAEVRDATVWEMWTEFGGCRAHWTSAASKARKTMKGWTPYPEDVRTRSSKGACFTFVNRNGLTFVGTQSELVERTGLSVATASRIARGQSVSMCGWHLEGVNWRAPNSPRDGSRPGRRGQVIKLFRGEEVIEGDRRAIATALQSTPGQVSAAVFLMRSGKAPKYKGWTLVNGEKCSDPVRTED